MVANVQTENGYTRIANEILENIAQIKLSPTQYRLIFIVWRYTYGFQRKEHNMSLTFLHEATGCDKRQIQRELTRLEERKIIFQTIKNGSYRLIQFNKNYEEWLETVGKTDNGKTTIGETTNGEIVKGGVGEIDNGAVGEIVKGTIGETTNQERKNLNKVFKEKLNKEDDDPATDPIIDLLIKNKIITMYDVNYTMQNDLEEIENSFGFENPDEMIREAIEDSARGGGRTWKFVYNKLNRWRKEGITSLGELKARSENRAINSRGYGGHSKQGKSYEDVQRELKQAESAWTN